MYKDSFFVRHQSSIIIIIVAVFVAAGLLIWLSVIKNNGGMTNNSATSTGLTDAQIQAIISDVPTGPNMETNQRTAIMNEKSSGSGAMTAEERDKILNENAK